MYKLSAPNYDSSKLKESVEDILGQTKLLSMATASLKASEPWINSAYFAYDEDLKLYIVTYPDSKHMKNLDENNQISLVIFDTNQDGQLKQGLQLAGMCRRVEKSEQDTAIKVWGSRIMGRDQVEGLLVDYKTWESKPYIIKIDYVKIFDEKRFGSETWVECSVER